MLILDFFDKNFLINLSEHIGIYLAWFGAIYKS